MELKIALLPTTGLHTQIPGHSTLTLNFNPRYSILVPNKNQGRIYHINFSSTSFGSCIREICNGTWCTACHASSCICFQDYNRYLVITATIFITSSIITLAQQRIEMLMYTLNFTCKIMETEKLTISGKN